LGLWGTVKMKALWIAVAAASVLVSQAASARPVCPQRDRTQSEAAWQESSRHYCEVRWNDLVTRNAAGDWTHPRFIDDCVKRCRAVAWWGVPTGDAGAVRAGPVLAATGAAAAVVGAVAIIRSDSRSDPKPASP
jgi:hypothetical protein